MRQLLPLVPLLFIMFAPPGFIHADQPSQVDAMPEDGQNALLMHAPNCFIMADGSQKCADIGMRTLALALLGVNYQNAVALTCFLRKPKADLGQPMQGGFFRGVRGGLEHVVKAETNTVAEPHSNAQACTFIFRAAVRS